MASPYLLQCALRNDLTAVLKTVPFATRAQNEAQEWRIPNIYLADLPHRTKEDVERAPFICLQEQGGKCVDSMEQVDILLRFVVFSHDKEAAAQELSNFVQITRQALFGFATKPLAQRFRLLISQGQGMLPWERHLEQQAPYAEAFVLSTWEYKGFEFNTAKGV